MPSKKARRGQIQRGQIDPEGRQSLQTAQLEAKLGVDVVQAQVTEPIADIAAGPSGTIAVYVNGDLGRWHEAERTWTTRSTIGISPANRTFSCKRSQAGKQSSCPR